MNPTQEDDLFTYTDTNGNTYTIHTDAPYHYQLGGGIYRIDHTDVTQDTMNHFLEWLNNQ